ncbi:carboxypeptidase-like regulatory domain-containing protein [Vibrio cincinnatiensis]|uniref:carboxypeptidase-like regulatory domain-containing protein n=1 Tax=Vibrio cincinnatiensis TaxID=675 RepID=UPI001EE07102|nr:carboxypeptidase-like regulatory domain-containing protein [Vibrio cincinnatiensis]MCG3734144.1 carboxypeptidase regulatory-like domain-containing protein [Vibrio cincinnatiensis]
MHKIFMLALALMLTFTCLSAEAGVFGWLKKTELELSPEVKGTITLHEKPVVGAIVHRLLSYGDREFNDKVTTDTNGQFNLPAKKARIRVSPMFDTWVSQVLLVEYAGKKVEVWTAGATSVLDSDSIKLLLSDVNCEISAPEMKIGIPRTNPRSPLLWMVTTCNFKHDHVIIEKELNK